MGRRVVEGIRKRSYFLLKNSISLSSKLRVYHKYILVFEILYTAITLLKFLVSN